MTPSLELKAAVVACCASTLGLGTWSILSLPDNFVRRAWARYCAALERKMYRAFIFRPGHRIAAVQLALLFATLVAALLAPLPPTAWVTLVFAISVGPALWLSRTLRKRLERLDGQVEPFLVCVSNALKSRPAVGDAIASVLTLVPNPLRQELELAVKQIRLGSSVEQALLHLSGRVKSKPLDTALSAILIGRQVGGNLPTILETTAAAMREMERLEGVVRTKTAQGKAQIWVLALFPFVLMLAFNAVSRGYFDPMTASVVGWVVTAIAFAMWFGSIVAARRILAVDI